MACCSGLVFERGSCMSNSLDLVMRVGPKGVGDGYGGELKNKP